MLCQPRNAFFLIHQVTNGENHAQILLPAQILYMSQIIFFGEEDRQEKYRQTMRLL
jgi:hypothetical protein